MILSRRTKPHNQTTRIIAAAERLAAQLRVNARRFMDGGSLHPTRARQHARDDREFWQFRPYQHGDSLRLIDWRKTAAGDDVLVRERQRHDDVTLSIWLDPSPSMSFAGHPTTPQKFERGLVMMLALIRALSHHDMNAVPILFHRIQTINLHEIASVYLHGTTPMFGDLSTLRINRGPVLLLSDFWGDIERTMAVAHALRARNHAVTLLQIADDAELNLPYQGRIRFHDGADDEIIPSAQDIRAAYQDRIATHLHTLALACRADDIGFLTHCSRNDAATILHEYLGGSHVGA